MERQRHRKIDGQTDNRKRPLFVKAGDTWTGDTAVELKKGTSNRSES